jgi:hypothetical protein
MMVSYGRNSEDAVLARLFTADHGYYVDLGANHPVDDSVTKHFYDRGWQGLNVEPLPDYFALLQAYRPRDVNCQVAMAGYEGNAETVRLMNLLDEHAVDHIDFMKIDVEGCEAAIINDTDWSVVRPRALVIEATVPTTTTPSHEPWESTLLAAGYVCTLFDGLNRFYAQADDTEAITVLSTPVNSSDGALPWRFVQKVQELEEALRNERLVCRHADGTPSQDADARLAALGHQLSTAAEEARVLARAADPGGQVLSR